jgi:hypothetical protein
MTVIVAHKSLFRSVFKNISGRDLWVGFIPPWGRTVKKGEIFSVPGDPRYADDPNSWPRHNTRVHNLITKGLIEFLSSPLPIVDNKTADGTSLTVIGDGSKMQVTRTTIPAEEAAARELPLIEPVVTYAVDTEQFAIDWSEFEGLKPKETFTVRVKRPGGIEDRVAVYRDRTAIYSAKDGLGEYTFTVLLTSIDGRVMEGVPVTETAV